MAARTWSHRRDAMTYRERLRLDLYQDSRETCPSRVPCPGIEHSTARCELRHSRLSVEYRGVLLRTVVCLLVSSCPKPQETKGLRIE